jgi:hypothetical protein
MADKFLIWWLRQVDYDYFPALDTWPIYIAREFWNRAGRPARGRLWVSPELGDDAPAEVTVECWWHRWARNTSGGIDGATLQAKRPVGADGPI